MKMKLNNVDVLQIAKALKCGWLDTDRIESFKSLVDGYNLPKEISRKELNYYLDCLYKVGVMSLQNGSKSKKRYCKGWTVICWRNGGSK